MKKSRLQVALAKAGVASRRKAAELTESNRVKVNGKVARDRSLRVDISKDIITLDEKPVFFEKGKHYYILNKPTGVLSTVKDERGRKTVFDYVKSKGARLYPVGRLDKDTTGLIVLTNNGELTYRLTHPKFEIDRVYEVKVKGAVKEKEVFCLKAGIIIDEKLAQVKKIVFRKKSPNFTLLLVTLREGRKRELRRMFKTIGHNVLELKRIAYGPLRLGGLKEGKVRPLTANELADLRNSVGL